MYFRQPVFQADIIIIITLIITSYKLQNGYILATHIMSLLKLFSPTLQA